MTKNEVLTTKLREQFEAGASDSDIIQTLEDAEHQVVSQNLLSGRAILIDADAKGTCCDPGTERYHSM